MRFFAFFICLIVMTGASTAQEIIGFPRSDFGKVVLSGKQSFTGKLEGSYGNYNNEPISNYNKRSIFARLGRSVGRLDILTNIRVFPCTGFLISPKYLITNYHCVPGILEMDVVREKGATRIDGVQIVLGYTREGIEEDASRYTVSPTPVEKSKALDYAILEVFGRPSDKFGTVKIASSAPYANQPFFIIGHPLGSAQKISREKCMSASPAISGGQVRHKCDTLPGNSGSPVFDQDTRSVIALHHAGSSRNSINYAIPFSRIVRQSPILQGLMKKKRLPKKKESKVAVGIYPEQPKPERHRLSFEPEVVHIPGGTFSMGCVSGKGCSSDEKPVHRVTVGSFYLSKYETTLGQFKAFVKVTGHKMGKCDWPSGKTWRDPGFSQGDNQPIVCVSWKDAVAYAMWLTKKTGQKWRLPTEAEWEYAARGDKSGKNKKKYSWGNRIDCSKASYDGGAKSSCYYRPGGKYRGTKAAGSFSANGFGLHDMHGNVWEWTNDWYGKYKKGSQTDPKGPNSGSYRVYRGGSWSYDAGYLRSAYRDSNSPDDRYDDLGFRLLRQPS